MQKFLEKMSYQIRSKQFWLLPSRAVRKYYRQTPVMQFPEEVKRILGRNHPRLDPLILTRSKLFTTNQGADGRQLISISDHYSSEHEIREDPVPYIAFARAIWQSGVLQDMQSVLDLGCSTGRLLEELKNNCDSTETRKFSGVDFFPYHGSSEFFPKGVEFFSADLRLKIDKTIEPADLVVCTETGEHIDPASIDIFLQNLALLAKRRLVLTWSGTYPPRGAPPQHLCALKTRQVHLLLRSYGFQFISSKTRRLKEVLNRENASPWWFESLSVWSAR